MQLRKREISLIKAMLAKGTWSQQEIAAYFSLPGRDFHQAKIGDIKKGSIYAHVPVATSQSLDTYLETQQIVASLEKRLTQNLGHPLVKYTYRFWPVGQGLFSTGKLELNGAAPFNWVYDCGTTSGETGPSIDRYIAVDHPTSRNILDIVTISHFDKDHISGISKLLTKISARTLLLPYMTPWKRLELIITSGLPASDPYVSFLRDPETAIRSIDGPGIDRIIFVVPGEGDSPDDDPPDLETPLPTENQWYMKIPSRMMTEEDRERFDPDALDKDPLEAELINSGTAIYASRLWEFVPWNLADYKPIFDAKFKKKVSLDARKFLHETNPKLSRKMLRNLKVEYESLLFRKKISLKAISGTSGQNYHRNRISLFLYSGPVGTFDVINTRNSYCMISSQQNWKWLGDLADGGRIGWMATGDGYLTTTEFPHFKKAYSVGKRLNKTGVFQVMHHGSKGNWHLGLAAKIRPVASVICSHYPKHKHPDHVVESDFKPFGLIRVDKDFGWTVKGDCCIR